MAKPANSRVAEIRKARGLSQQQLADAVGAHWITISKLERGKMQLTFSWIERLSEALEVLPAELISDNYHSALTQLNAEVSNTEVKVFNLSLPAVNSDLYETDENDSLWLRISDHSCRPFFKEGDLIKFVKISSGHIQDHVGRIALALDGHSDKLSIGYIEIGSDGLTELRRINAPIIRSYAPSEVWIAAEIKFYLITSIDPP